MKILKRKRIFFLLLISLVTFLGVSDVFAYGSFTNSIDTARTSVKAGNGTKLVTKAKTTSIPVDYSMFGFFKIRSDSPEVEYKNYITPSSTVKSTWENYGTDQSTYLSTWGTNAKPTTAPSKDAGSLYTACYPKVGIYNNKWIDVKGEVLDYEKNTSYIEKWGSNYEPVMGFSSSYYATTKRSKPSVDSNAFNWIKVKWSFYEYDKNATTGNHCKGSAISVKGNVTYWDVDNDQGIRLDGSNFNNVYISSSSNALYYINAAYGSSTTPLIFDYTNPDAEKQVDQTTTNKNYAFTEIFSGSSMTRIYSFYTRKENARGGIEMGYNSINKVETPDPVKKVSSKYLGLSSTVDYKIEQQVPLQDSTHYYTSFVIQDVLDPAFDMTYTTTDNVKVLNSNGTVVNYFDISITGNTVKATAKAASLTNDNFYGDVYTVVVPVKVKENYDFSSYDKCSNTTYPKIMNSASSIFKNTGESANTTKDTSDIDVCVVPDPTKEYDENSASGKDGAAVKPGDVITYKVSYVNNTSSSATVTVTDILSKGLSYKTGTAKIGGTAVDPTVTNNSDGTTTLVWSRTMEAGAMEELTYSAEVDGIAEGQSLTQVKNNANIKIGTQTKVLTELINPIKKVSIIVKYLEEGTNNVLASQEELEKNYGERYDTVSKEDELYLYDLVSTPSNASGVANQDSIIVTYYFKKKQGTVITKYLEEGTNRVLADQESVTKDYGEEYTTIQKDIDNYDLLRVDGDVSGIVSKGSTEIVYYYRLKQATLTVHHYEKGTTRKLAEDEVSTKNYTENYTTSSKNITNYEYDSTSGDSTSGVISKDNTEVIYYYKLKQGVVITKHLEKGTNRELASAVTDNYHYGDTYTTTEANVGRNYNLDSISGEASGVIDKDRTEVIYYYVKKASNINDTIEKTGTNEIISTNDNVNYKVEYNAKITDYIGSVDITITDRLPYKINRNSSDLDGGTYNEENSTITWKQRIDNYDSYNDGEINITKNVRLVYTNINKADRIMTNEVTGNIELDSAESSVETTKNTNINIPGRVIVKYLEDGTNRVLADQESITKNYGEEYTTVQKSVDNYDFLRVDGDVSGIINRDSIEVIYYYKLKQATLTVHHYEKGTTRKLANDEISTKNYTENYTTSALDDITNYEYDSTSGDSTSGVVNKDSIEVIYYYKLKKGTVIAKYLEEGTNIELADQESITKNYGEEYTTVEKNIDNYKLVRTDGVITGLISKDQAIVIYYYKLKQGTLTVHHYEKGTTRKLAEDEVSIKNYLESYTTSSKDNITNYEYDSTSGDSTSGVISKDNTEVIYYYKLKQGVVITKHLEKGTNRELASAVTDNYHYGETYTTTETNVGRNYNLDSISGEASGVIDKDRTEVIYYYVKKASNINDTIEKTGTNEIISTNDNVNYKVEYNAKITDYIGSVDITITDRLPYKINRNSSDLDGGTYNEENSTITWKQRIDNYDSYNDGEINITKNVTLVYTNINKADRIMTNEVTGNIELDSAESSVETTKNTNINIPGRVIVKYVDTNGKEIAKQEVKKGLVGETVSTESKKIEGYNLIKKPNSEMIKLTENDQESIYVYEKIKHSIITRTLSLGGTISGDEIVEHGVDEVKTVKIKAEKGYWIQEVRINGKVQNIDSKLRTLSLPKFKNVKEDKLVEVRFEGKEYETTVPNTASFASIVGTILGISLISSGSYIVYRKYKKA